MENQQKASFREVWKAKHRIQHIAVQTPLVYSEPLSLATGTHIYLKLENLQPTGAFKIRGAANTILSLSEAEQQKGVATFSTGNHGIAVAYVAKQLGIPAVVCISNRVPEEKVSRLKRLGARVKVVGSNQDDAQEYCDRLEQETGMTVIQPFDDPRIIHGQGTIGLEIMEQCPQLDQVVLPLSGGGLIAGVGFSMNSIDPTIHVTGLSMERSAVMYESLKLGYPVKMEEEDTLADSLLGGLGSDNRHTFAMTQTYMNEVGLVSEDAIAKGILYLLKHHKMAVEGAAAIGVGWLLEKKRMDHEHVVLIISGNNIDHQTLSHLIKNS